MEMKKLLFSQEKSQTIWYKYLKVTKNSSRPHIFRTRSLNENHYVNSKSVGNKDNK